MDKLELILKNLWIYIYIYIYKFKMNLKLFFLKVFFNGKMVEINKERDVNLCTFKCPFFFKSWYMH